LPHS